MAVSIDPRARGNGAQASPPATRAERSRWRDPRLVVGIALVAVSALLGARLLGDADQSVGVWVARHGLAPGHPLTAQDVTSRQVRFAGQGDADQYLSSEQAPPAGAVLSRAVGAGELVPRRAVGSASPTQLTEVPLSVDAQAVPSDLGPGSVVDVWVTPGEPETARPRTPRSVLVFDDVPVVSAPRTATSLGPSTARQVIVGVTKTQAADLPTALSTLVGGAVTLTMTR